MSSGSSGGPPSSPPSSSSSVTAPTGSSFPSFSSGIEADCYGPGDGAGSIYNYIEWPNMGAAMVSGKPPVSDEHG